MLYRIVLHKKYIWPDLCKLFKNWKFKRMNWVKKGKQRHREKENNSFTAKTTWNRAKIFGFSTLSNISQTFFFIFKSVYNVQNIIFPQSVVRLRTIFSNKSLQIQCLHIHISWQVVSTSSRCLFLLLKFLINFFKLVMKKTFILSSEIFMLLSSLLSEYLRKYYLMKNSRFV